MARNLTEAARQMGVSLAALLAANPQIQNPNIVTPQQIANLNRPGTGTLSSQESAAQLARVFAPLGFRGSPGFAPRSPGAAQQEASQEYLGFGTIIGTPPTSVSVPPSALPAPAQLIQPSQLVSPFTGRSFGGGRAPQAPQPGEGQPFQGLTQRLPGPSPAFRFIGSALAAGPTTFGGAFTGAAAGAFATLQAPAGSQSIVDAVRNIVGGAVEGGRQGFLQGVQQGGEVGRAVEQLAKLGPNAFAGGLTGAAAGGVGTLMRDLPPRPGETNLQYISRAAGIPIEIARNAIWGGVTGANQNVAAQMAAAGYQTGSIFDHRTPFGSARTTTLPGRHGPTRTKDELIAEAQAAFPMTPEAAEQIVRMGAEQKYNDILAGNAPRWQTTAQFQEMSDALGWGLTGAELADALGYYFDEATGFWRRLNRDAAGTAAQAGYGGGTFASGGSGINIVFGGGGGGGSRRGSSTGAYGLVMWRI